MWLTNRAVVVAVVLLLIACSILSVFTMPEGHGYLGDHALYYVPAVIVTAAIWVDRSGHRSRADAVKAPCLLLNWRYSFNDSRGK